MGPSCRLGLNHDSVEEQEALQPRARVSLEEGKRKQDRSASSCEFKLLPSCPGRQILSPGSQASGDSWLGDAGRAGTCPSAPAPLPATAPCASARAALGKGAPSRRDWGTLGSFLLQELTRAAPAPSTTQALCFGDEESHGALQERVWGSRGAILGAPPGQEAGSHRGLPGTSTPLPGHELPQHELNPRHCCS